MLGLWQSNNNSDLSRDMTTSYLQHSYRHKTKTTGYDHQLVRQLLHRAGMATGSAFRVLDLGAGTGAFQEPFTAAGGIYSGVDADNDSRDHNIVRCNIAKEVLPFSDDSFELVFCKMVIEHLTVFELPFVLTEAKRVLTSTGRLILITPDWKRSFRSFYDEFTHITPYTRTSLRTALEIGGFRPTVVDNLIQLPWSWRHRHAHCLLDLIAPLESTPLKRFKLINYAKHRPLLSIASPT